MAGLKTAQGSARALRSSPISDVAEAAMGRSPGVRGTMGSSCGVPRKPELARRAPVYSAGISIQPWRMAYTTAWVRSLTESFRRMELMWFLTVCSLIESA